MPTTMVASSGQARPKRRAFCAGVPASERQDRQRGLGARLLGRVLGVGGDGDLASVALGGGQVAGREDADAHHAHVVGGAAMQQAVEVGRVPAGASALVGGRIEQVVVDLRCIEPPAVDRLMHGLGIAEAGQADPVAQRPSGAGRP